MISPSSRPAAWLARLWLPWSLIALAPLLLVAVGRKLSPPMLNPDSAIGFSVWEARGAGGPWNCYREVDPADIAREVSVFLTWWLPGQYELAGWWRKPGFSWGHVILLSSLTSVWIAAVGYRQLARAFGAGTLTAAWFAAVSTLQWHTLFGFGHLRGGDVVLGAAAPWMILWAWLTRTRPWAFLIGIPLLLAGGLYLKLSAALAAPPLLLASGVSNAWELRSRPVRLVAWLLASVAIRRRAAVIGALAALTARSAPRSSLIYVPIPMLGLELPRQRVLLTDDFTIRREHQWRGRVENLTVTVPDEMESDGRGARARGQFIDHRHDEWHGEHLAGWWFWNARTTEALSL